MGVLITDAVFDVLLEHIADNGNRLCVCKSGVATYADAITADMLAFTALDTGVSGADYSKDGGSGSNGRELNVAEQAAITVTNNGTAAEVVIVDTVNEVILAITTIPTPVAITTPNTTTVPTFIITARDAT